MESGVTRLENFTLRNREMWYEKKVPRKCWYQAPVAILLWP